jgi:hypothetical protein
MINIFLKRNESNETREFSAVLRGLLALATLFITIAIDVMIIDKRHELGSLHIPDKDFIIGSFAFLIYLIAGVGITFNIFKELDELKKNKALLVFLTGLGITCIVMSIYTGASLYSDYKDYIDKIALPLALPFINYLSLFIIAMLLYYQRSQQDANV